MAEKTEKDLIELAKELGFNFNITIDHEFIDGENFIEKHIVLIKREKTLTKEQK